MSKKGEDEIDKIVGKRVNNNNKTEYHIKQVGYDDVKDYTWEPAVNLSNCKQMIRDFEQSPASNKVNTAIRTEPEATNGKAIKKSLSKVSEEQVPTAIRGGRRYLEKNQESQEEEGSIYEEENDGEMSIEPKVAQTKNSKKTEKEQNNKNEEIENQEVENLNQFGSGNRGKLILEDVWRSKGKTYFKVNDGGPKINLSQEGLMWEDQLTLLYFYENRIKFRQILLRNQKMRK